MTEIPDDVRELASRLFDMARNGDETLVQYIDHGISPDLSNADGNSLLMLAAYAGHDALVGALIERGADVDKENGRRQTPLAGAVFKKYPEVVDRLVAAGADVNAGAPSALETARYFQITDMLERLGVEE
ncbi:ankyrin repeat domain-containing protein [Corynebacterium hylobatis]|uniref:Ankyrin repeat domain-containing protein n=1 Tax=Corynebacterium hylobatis TaxID=1859290 RepID=A0A3S0AVN8_9CORY|nr:ankyrin repeat domain-containing protein [Corynebacterium hylobatis]RSZ62364.1 ankyrin repeat domain-containing protein [Corynebacterium hylobatis]